ncbi:MAG TPA: SPFH domain-containing protein [Firmicutes bacterium]|nr:SPFH domain-containing protein [Bacillota bacterium]
MGLFDFIRGQTIDVIEAAGLPRDMVVYRFPVQDNEIKMGANLTVREGQCAVFVSEGTIADVFGPGRYELETGNMPVLTKLKSWPYGFKSPFKAEVYFISTTLLTDQKWGTSNPILLRDAEFGMVRLQAYGVYSYRVVRPEVFLRQIFGTLSTFSAQELAGYLRRLIVSSLSDVVGEKKVPAIDIASQYEEIGGEVRQRMQASFGEMGLELQKLVVENISLPENVEKAIDQRTSMGVLGDMHRYTQYQTAEAIRDFAKNEGAGGFAGMGAGLGAGFHVGQAVAGGFAAQPAAPASAPTPTAAKKACPSCGKEIDEEAKFCPHCGKPAASLCPKCGAETAAGAKFCSSCGAALTVTCPKCGAEVAGRFCSSCGEPRP